MSMKPPSKPPPTKEDVERAEREFEEACASVDEKAKKHDHAAKCLKKTISDPKFRAVRIPTPSQLELEQPKPPPLPKP